MTEQVTNYMLKLYPYWVCTSTKGLSSSISIVQSEEEALRIKKKYEKDGYICIIEKKS
jgi:hypothetical protein